MCFQCSRLLLENQSIELLLLSLLGIYINICIHWSNSVIWAINILKKKLTLPQYTHISGCFFFIVLWRLKLRRDFHPYYNIIYAKNHLRPFYPSSPLHRVMPYACLTPRARDLHSRGVPYPLASLSARGEYSHRACEMCLRRPAMQQGFYRDEDKRRVLKQGFCTIIR